MAKSSRATSGVAWSFLQNIGARLISFGVFALLGRLLSPEDFGMVALAQASVEILTVLVDQGGGSFLVHRESLKEADRSTAFWTSVALAGVLAAVVSFLAPIISRASDTPDLSPILRLLCVGMFLRALSTVPSALLAREFRFRALALRSLAAALIAAPVGVAGALAGWGAYALVAQTLAAQLTATCALWLACRWRPALLWSFPHAKQQFGYAIGSTGASVIQAAWSRVDSFIIAPLLGSANLGIYVIARRVMLICTNVISKSGDAVALSTFSRLQEDRPARSKAFHQALGFSFLVTAPCFVGLSILAPDVVPLLMGPQWGKSVPILQVFCVAGIAMSPAYIASAMLRAVGQPGRLVYFQSLVLGIFLSLAFLLIHLGTLGVALAYSGALVAAHPALMLFTARAAGVGLVPWLKNFWRIALSCAAMGTVVWAAWKAQQKLPGGRALRVSTATALGVATYLLALRLLAPHLFALVMAVPNVLRARRKGHVDED